MTSALHVADPLLQVMHKAPLVEAKQIEHVANERAILGEVSHPFLVGLVGAYQDTGSLYLLQVGEGLAPQRQYVSQSYLHV